MLDEVYDLFIDLGADEDQLEFPVLYAVGRDGVASPVLEERGENLNCLFDLILERIPGPVSIRRLPSRCSFRIWAIRTISAAWSSARSRPDICWKRRICSAWAKTIDLTCWMPDFM